MWLNSRTHFRFSKFFFLILIVLLISGRTGAHFDGNGSFGRQWDNVISHPSKCAFQEPSHLVQLG
ncbi:hypothetical protein D3C76_1696780 [compost metagenome]